MEEKVTNKITKFQLFFILIQSQVGVAFLALPHIVQQSAKGDGWISTLIAGIAIQVMLLIYWQLLRRFPTLIFTEITQKILGIFLGRIVNFFIYLNFILVGGLAMILFIKLINLWLLPLTPRWMISLLILTASIYMAINDLKMIARFFVLVSFLILFLWFTSIFSWFIPKDIHYILPIGNSGFKEILMGSNKSLLAMLGFEGLLFFLPLVIENKKGVMKTITMSNLFITLFYTYFVFITLISFSADQLLQMREPILNLLRGLTYEMIDRVDLIFLSIWIVPMTTSVIIYLYFASKSLNIEKKHYPKVVFLNGIILFLITLIPHDDAIIDIFNKYVSYLNYIVIFLAPSLLLILSLIMKKHEMSESI